MADKSLQFSARLSEPIVRRLREHADVRGQSQRQLAERYIDEGLRMDDHPGIVFRDGPLGRRAGLAGGPDVWEIVAALKRLPARGPAAVHELAELVSLSVGQIRTALDYYGAYPDEVEEIVRRNESASAKAEAVWRRQQTALE